MISTIQIVSCNMMSFFESGSYPPRGHKVVKKILFLHGLESGPNGVKAKYLKRRFSEHTVLTPDLQTGTWEFASNSIIAQSFWNIHHIFTGNLYNMTCRGMIEGAAAIAASVVQQEAPDVVVGSSMGGAVALELLRLGVVQVPTVLLAPAYKRLNLGAADTRQIDPSQAAAVMDPLYEELRANVVASDGESVRVPILVVHGDADDTINIEDSIELCERLRCAAELIHVSGGDHRLNDHLLDGENQLNLLDDYVRRFLLGERYSVQQQDRAVADGREEDRGASALSTDVEEKENANTKQ